MSVGFSSGRPPLCYVRSACRQVNSLLTPPISGTCLLSLDRSDAPLCADLIYSSFYFLQSHYRDIPGCLPLPVQCSAAENHICCTAVLWCRSIIFRSWPQKLGFYCTLKTHRTLCSCLFCYAASSRASCATSRFPHRSPALQRFISALPQTSPCTSHASALPPAHTWICTPAAFLRITTVRQPAELQGAGLFSLSVFVLAAAREKSLLSLFATFVCKSA